MKLLISMQHLILQWSLFILLMTITSWGQSDPCLSYQPGTAHCNSCQPGYKFALINESTTLCAATDLSSCWLNDSYYSNDPAYLATFSYLITFTVENDQCFNCTTFFMREDGQSLCYSGCPVTDPKDFIAINIDDQSLGCDTCALLDYQMNTILDYSFIGLFVKTCTQNIEDVACTWQEVYDYSSKRCIPCYQKFPKCAACNLTHCLIIIKQYSYATSLYNYSSRAWDIDQHLFYTCNKHKSGYFVGDGCLPQVEVENCAQSSFNDLYYEFCWICEPDYYLEYVFWRCVEREKGHNKTFFIKSGAEYNTTVEQARSYFETTGESPSSPFYFLGQAYQKALELGVTHNELYVTFYIGKGDHFFFYCNSLTGTIFNAPGIIEYCDDYSPLLSQILIRSDNYFFYFKPLYCSLGAELGLEQDSEFLGMCVGESDGNPTIYVNQAYAYFQIYTFARFENLHFSGVNQLIRPVKISDDLSTIPFKFCEVLEEPQVGDQALHLEKNEAEDFNVRYKCINQNYTGSTVPHDHSTFACQRNNWQDFFLEQESTLSCAGEPSYHFYFGPPHYLPEFVQYGRRMNTLFNLIALPEYTSAQKGPPELQLENCTFSYFLQNYESLINVQTQDYYLIEYGPLNHVEPEDIEPYQFLMSNAGERGAKIHIKSSEFRHSAFCKGLIVYRKQHYITVEELGFGNYSYQLLEFDPYVPDHGSFILLEGSKFFHLNAGFQNISALAIYGGVEVMRDIHLKGGNLQRYQGFIHKGTVLNVEDFGGWIEIRDCHFQFNMHWVPQILNRPSRERGQLDTFMDSSYTFEYKLAVCDAETQQDKFLFSSALTTDDDIDSLYDAFERLSTIYISRNREKVIIQNNSFNSNVGTFGGAISINSQNFQAGHSPYILISYNNFTMNTAYLSGNAVYIRNSLLSPTSTSSCGGIAVHDNNFLNNTGTSFSNGGALSLSCYYLKQKTQQDYFSSSNQEVNDWAEITQIGGETIARYLVTVQSNTFVGNLAGGKGSALYSKQVSSLMIKDNVFEENGPVLSQLEQESFIVKYMAKRAFTFVGGNGCETEFEYVSYCQQMGENIHWSKVQGTIYAEYCQSSWCLNSQISTRLSISDSQFLNNQIGYVLDQSFSNNQSSQIQILGGANNSIENCTFDNSRGLQKSLLTPKLLAHFPPYYFDYHHSSLISISYYVDYKGEELELRNFVKNCSFRNNRHAQIVGLGEELQYYGSLIRIMSPKSQVDSNYSITMTISGCNFTNNSFLGQQTSLIYSMNALLAIQDCEFKQNGAAWEDIEAQTENTEVEYFQYEDYERKDFQDIGILYIEGIKRGKKPHEIKNNWFEANQAQRSTIIQINFGNQELYMSGNTIKNNIAFEGGIFGSFGSISSTLYSTSTSYSGRATSTIFVQGDVYDSLISQSGIFSLMLQSEELLLNLFVFSSQFTDNYQFSDYSLFSLAGIGKVLLSDSQFSVTKNLELIEEHYGEAFGEVKGWQKVFEQKQDYLSSSKMFVANNTWNQQQNIFFGEEELEMNSEYWQFSEIINCTIERLSSKTETVGTLARLGQQSKLLLMRTGEEGKIKDCNVGQNGLFFVSSSDLVIKNADISGTICSYTTSLIYATAFSHIQIYSSSFSSNTAYTYGLFYITGSSSFLCQSCIFSSNSVTEDSSILYADNNPRSKVTFSDSYFSDNESRSNLMTLVSTETIITNSSFIDNYSQLINNGLTVTNSHLLLDGVTVNFTREEFLEDNSFEVDICFFNINFQAVLVLENTVVQNCRGGTAGVLSASGYSEVYIRKDSRFVKNKSSKDGSAMYFLTMQHISIEDSYFGDNGVVDVYVQRSEAVIRNSTFEGGEEQFVYGQVASFQIEHSTFKNAANLNIRGKGLYCSCNSLMLVNSTFTNLSSTQGGALYLISSSQQANFTILSNVFITNFGQQGGAVYVHDAVEMLMLGNQFWGNKVQVIEPKTEVSQLLVEKGLGGALFLQCQNKEINLFNNCKFRLDENLFQDNFASDDGGAILKVSNDYQSDIANTFVNNQAVYGPDEGSYPAYLQILFVSNNDYHAPLNYSYSLSTDFVPSSEPLTFPPIVSSTVFSFLAVIRDQAGGIYETENESVASLKSIGSQEVLLNGNEVKAYAGVFNFSTVTAITVPGSELTLKLEVIGLEDFGNEIQFLQNPLEVGVVFRNCVEGEQMLNWACEKCPYGYYLYEAPEENTNCKLCQEDAVCQGQNVVYPKKNYWRETNTSEDWILCPRIQSCLEGDPEHQTAKCQEGYEGIVCGICSTGYSRTGDFECGKCPDKVKNIIKISFIMLFLVILVMGLVYTTLRSSSKQKVGYSVYIKIMTSHFQIISAIANVNFEWPNYLDTLYQSLVSVSQMSEQVFSIDCFIIEGGSQISQRVGVYFTILLFYALLPVLIGLASLLFWTVYSGITCSFANFKNRFISTLVVLLFLIHPTLTQEMLQSFNCIKVGEVYFLKDDLSYECYKGQHLRFLLLIVIPSVLLWCIGIPLAVLIILIRKRQLIQKEDSPYQLSEEEAQEMADFRAKFGFIFNGYKSSSFYYEVIIQYRKVLLIMVTVILSVVSPEIQVLLSFLILIFGIWYSNMKQPFLTGNLNRMELLSLAVAITTIYSGLYFITAQHYDYAQSPYLQWFFFILLLVPNATFFIYWLFYISLELLKYAHSKGKRLFCIVSCGVCKYDQFRKKYMASELESENKPSSKEESSGKSKEEHHSALGFMVRRAKKKAEEKKGERYEYVEQDSSLRNAEEKKEEAKRHNDKGIVNFKQKLYGIKNNKQDRKMKLIQGKKKVEESKDSSNKEEVKANKRYHGKKRNNKSQDKLPNLKLGQIFSKN